MQWDISNTIMKCCYSAGALAIVCVATPLLIIGIQQEILYGYPEMGRCNTTSVSLRPEQGGENAGQIITLNVNVVLEKETFAHEFEKVCDCFENHIVCITCENMMNQYSIDKAYTCWWYFEVQELLVYEIKMPGVGYIVPGAVFAIIGLLFIVIGYWTRKN